eukprot:6682562-Karenia_brevis.AAC.1
MVEHQLEPTITIGPIQMAAYGLMLAKLAPLFCMVSHGHSPDSMGHKFQMVNVKMVMKLEAINM